MTTWRFVIEIKNRVLYSWELLNLKCEIPPSDSKKLYPRIQSNYPNDIENENVKVLSVVRVRE